MGAMNLSAPCHFLQGLAMNAKKICGLFAVEQRFEFSHAERSKIHGMGRERGKGSSHKYLLFQENALVFHRLSKTFWVNADTR